MKDVHGPYSCTSKSNPPSSFLSTNFLHLDIAKMVKSIDDDLHLSSLDLSQYSAEVTSLG